MACPASQNAVCSPIFRSQLVAATTVPIVQPSWGRPFQAAVRLSAGAFFTFRLSLPTLLRDGLTCSVAVLLLGYPLSTCRL